MTLSFRRRKKEIALFNRATRENIQEVLDKRGMPLSRLAQARVLFLLSDLPMETPEAEVPETAAE